MDDASLSRLKVLADNTQPLVNLFAEEPQRSRWLTLDACGIHADFSRQRINREIFDALVTTLEDCNIRQHFDAMFAGEFINSTEDRQVLHVACRQSGTADHEIVLAAKQLEAALELAERIRHNPTITTVINIGIGGSDLGPHMAVNALSSMCDGPEVRFVSNVDPANLDHALRGLDPHHTMVVVSSKTFTTQETMLNAERARQWMIDADVAWEEHFVASTAQPSIAMQWGIAPAQCLQFFDWVGGRYSLSSVIGFPVMVAIGQVQFREFLRGMADMDVHVQRSPTPTNLPFIHAAIWFMNAVVYQYSSVAVVPYSFYLDRLPAFLQQLVMESNGKSVSIDGVALQHPSSPVVWGEPGTNSQHAFFQMLHQGTLVVPVEFISSVQPMGRSDAAHEVLLANMIAQSEALAVGQQGVSLHRLFPGNRPSSVLLMDKLDPYHLGALIAMYEHSVAVQGWLMNINSFDQFGVELGKQMAVGVASLLQNNDSDSVETLTHPLVNWLREKKKNLSTQ